ncbi:hypothetical protein NDU88_009441 [Pleurodeles waltl]|uniref:Uncharacterized protein n=1 Tax=Pleurodeles waltl TaxID=8319 RepID=A0AAV7QT11_PLEWA|nr:hypothetical protein NDU88_009441 [Pleurodeles waltl]
MPRLPCACSTDRCWRFTVFWRLPPGSWPRGQAPEDAARRIERCALSPPDRARPRCFLVVAVGVWDVRMAPKPSRTPCSLRARQSQDPGGTRKDKKLPVPGLKEHSNLYTKGALQKTTDMEKDTRNSVPTMFTSMMRIKQMPTEKAVRGMEPASLETTSTSPENSGEVVVPPLVGGEKSSEQEPKELKQGLQESNPEKCDVQSCALSSKAHAQQAEGMVKHSTTHETITPASAQRGKEAKPANSDQGPFDAAESFFSLSDQSRDSDIDEEIPLTDSDIEGSSAASIWVSNYSTCRRKSFEQTGARCNSGVKLRRDSLNPQEEDGEMQWDYTATQQAFLKRDLACNTLVPPPTDGPAEPPSLDLIYRTMVQNHEQAQRESRKVKSANRQLQLSIKKVVKSCQDIGARIASMETGTEELESEVRAATAQTMTQGQQISDIQWKLEDAENRQRRNDLRILGIAEDLEGQDTRAYIASLFKKAFPDLTGSREGLAFHHVSSHALAEVPSAEQLLDKVSSHFPNFIKASLTSSSVGTGQASNIGSPVVTVRLTVSV